MTDIPFFTEKGELIERTSTALFYGESVVMSTWGSGLGTGIGGGLLGSGFSTTSTRKEEKQQGTGTLFLTNKRLVFAKDEGKAQKVIFSVALPALQSVNYQTKTLGLLNGIGLSFSAGNAIQTASFYGLDTKDKGSADSWVQTVTSSVHRIQEGNQTPDQAVTISQDNMKFCRECGKQIRREVKFCEFCGSKSNP